MMNHACVPRKHLVNAFSTAVFLINRLPSTVLDMHSPYQRLLHKKVNFESFRSRCYPYLRDYAQDKFSPKSLPCVFMGYSTRHKGYSCLYPPTGRLYISRHVVFDECFFPFANPQKLHISFQGPWDITAFHEWVDIRDPAVSRPTS